MNETRDYVVARVRANPRGCKFTMLKESVRFTEHNDGLLYGDLTLTPEEFKQISDIIYGSEKKANS